MKSRENLLVTISAKQKLYNDSMYGIKNLSTVRTWVKAAYNNTNFTGAEVVELKDYFNLENN